MTTSVQVTIHPSQFSDNVRRDLLASLRTRRVNHKFHYDSVKQTQKWLALHEAHSPARTDTDCLSTYGRAFAEAARIIRSKQIHVIGLGCGGGQKDVQLLNLLKSCGREASYTPSDVSVAMVLVARQAALGVLPEKKCFPFVCDLETAVDLQKHLINRHRSLVTFFGMIPNFEPGQILPKLTRLLRPKDFLLFSANLAPGDNYAAGMEKILPQYDNPLTRNWLSAFLFDLGVEPRDGQLCFTAETGGMGLQRVVARFHFVRACQVRIDGKIFSFSRREFIRLFFSYRYTPMRAKKILANHKLKVINEWVTPSGEEGVFLCRRK